MNQRLISVCVVPTLIALALVFDTNAQNSKTIKVRCPVSGRPGRPTATAEYQGKTLYFCCNNCPKAFLKKPGKFLHRAHHQLLQTGQIIQVVCAITGKELDDKRSLDIDGVTVNFCCSKCKTDHTFERVFSKLQPAFTLQTKCPVTGRRINRDIKTTYRQRDVYCCSKQCAEEFMENPTKYAKKLPRPPKDE